MIIPNDKGGDWRIDKFVEYQNAVPPVQYEIFKSYAKNHSLSKDNMVYLSWLMANTYQELTSLLTLEENPLSKNFSERAGIWFTKNDERLIFGSAKKHMRYKERIHFVLNWFEDNFGQNPYDSFMELASTEREPEKRYQKVYTKIRDCKNVGRYAADYFLEHCHLFQELGLDTNIKSEDTILWDEGSNLTSGLLNMLYLDEIADKFDQGKLSKKELEELKPELNKVLKTIQAKIKENYNKDVPVEHFVTKVCSYRNLYKNSRYGGYHHDRQLAYLKQYEESWKEKENLWKEVYQIRKEVFPNWLLGEENNWDNIRKERKRLWTTYGLTGVESESLKIGETQSTWLD